MKSDRGVTLASLIIYVIGMLIVIGSVATLTTFFYKNIDIDSVSSNETTEYSNFSKLFTDEVNKEDNYVIEAKETTETIVVDGSSKTVKVNYIIFGSGNQYTFMEENNAIYKNNIKICSNVDSCVFSYEYKDLQYRINVEYKAGKIDYTGGNK